jgi:hypothetical protein
VKRRLLVAGGLLSVAFGCAEIYGLGDYTELDGGLDAGSDAPSDVVLTNDTGTCIATCVPALPVGWTLIAYDQAFRTSCAANYGTPTDVEEGLSAAAATCGCSCSLTKPGCTSLLVTSGDSGTCANQSSQSVTSDGGCTSLTSISAQNVKVSVTPSGSGTCAPDASVVKPPISYTDQGRLCELDTTPAGGCQGGLCVPDPAPYIMCVRQAGVAACPSGYPVSHVVGTKVDDTRNCTPCTCSFDGGACGGTATLYTGATCGATSQALTADGTCQSTSSQSFKSLVYQPGNTGTCAPSSVGPMGDAGFADPVTICCMQ